MVCSHEPQKLQEATDADWASTSMVVMNSRETPDRQFFYGWCLCNYSWSPPLQRSIAKFIRENITFLAEELRWPCNKGRIFLPIIIYQIDQEDFQDFIPKLKSSALTPQVWNRPLQFYQTKPTQDNCICWHNTTKFNYTIYDIWRSQDAINPQTEYCSIWCFYCDPVTT